MARLDETQPPLVPRMVRLDQNDWDRLTARAQAAGIKPSVLVRRIVSAGLDSLETADAATSE